MSNYSELQKIYLKKLGNNIAKIRLSKSISQEELAFKSSLHRTYIGSVERGERNISILNLQIIAKALDIDIKLLLDF